jgi:hypothetical protein
MSLQMDEVWFVLMSIVHLAYDHDEDGAGVSRTMLVRLCVMCMLMKAEHTQRKATAALLLLLFLRAC